MTPEKSDSLCEQCGAALTDLLCGYCGTPSAALRKTESVEAQLQAVKQLHQAVAEAKEAVARIRLLESGYVPSQRQALVQDGLECFQLIYDGKVDAVSSAAVRRLEALVVRLRLLPDSSENQKILQEFTQRLDRHRQADRSLGRQAMVFVLVILICIIALVVFIIRRC